MALPRDIRRLAFQVLFQIDATGGAEVESSAVVGEAETLSMKDRAKAAEMAQAAYAQRADADAAMLELAPGWPAHRQPAVDRAILRLAHYELVSVKAGGPIVISEAVELAKEFGTEKSPAFVNALLDKIHKKMEGGEAVAGEIPPPA